MKHDKSQFKDAIASLASRDDTLTQKQVAELAGCSVRTVQRSNLRALRVGRERRYLRAHVHAWLAERARK